MRHYIDQNGNHTIMDDDTHTITTISGGMAFIDRLKPEHYEVTKVLVDYVAVEEADVDVFDWTNERTA